MSAIASAPPRRRLLLVAPLLLAGMLQVGSATSSQAAVKWPAPLPVAQRLYFHSAAGGYFKDWQTDPSPGRAPAGSTLSPAPPTGTTDVSVTSVTPQKNAGEPNYATFAFPYSGPLTSMCIDVWAQSLHNSLTSAVGLYVYVAFVPPGVPQAESKPVVPLAVARVDQYDASEQRVTARLLWPPSTTVPTGSALLIGADSYAQNYDWSMRYDSTERFGSITINPTSCTPRIPAKPALISYAGPTLVKKGSTAVLLTRVTDPGGKPLAKQAVTLTVENKGYLKVLKGTTKPDGSLSVPWTVGAPAGPITLTIETPGTASVAANSGQVTLTVS